MRFFFYFFLSGASFIFDFIFSHGRNFAMKHVAVLEICCQHVANIGKWKIEFLATYYCNFWPCFIVKLRPVLFEGGSQFSAFTKKILPICRIDEIVLSKDPKFDLITTRKSNNSYRGIFTALLLFWWLISDYSWRVLLIFEWLSKKCSVKLIISLHFKRCISQFKLFAHTKGTICKFKNYKF